MKTYLIIAGLILLSSQAFAQYSALNPVLQWELKNIKVTNYIFLPKHKEIQVFHKGDWWGYDLHSLYKGKTTFLNLKTGTTLSEFYPCSKKSFGSNDMDKEESFWVVACKSGKLEIWDFRKKKLLTNVEAAQKEYKIRGPDVSPNGNRLITFERLKKEPSYGLLADIFTKRRPFYDRFGFWNLETGKFIRYLDPPNAFERGKRLRTSIGDAVFYKFSNKGDIFVASYNGSMRLWRTEDGKHLLRFRDDRFQKRAPSYIDNIIFSKDDLLIAASARRKGVEIYDILNGKLIRRLHLNGTSSYTQEFSANNEFLVTTDKDNWIKYWRLKDGKLLWKRKSKCRIPDLSFSPDKKFLFASGRSKHCKGLVLKVNTGEILWKGQGLWRITANWKFLANYHKKEKTLRLYRLKSYD